jgi:hypothetical protein
MSITIKGATSGGADLKAPDTGTNTTVTLPSATGTLLTTDGDGSALTNLTSGNLNGALPAIDGSALTGIVHPSSAAGGTITATTDGALSAGQATLIQANGTVKGVAGTTGTQNIPNGTNNAIVTNTNIDIIGIALDRYNSGKGVVAWRDGTSYNCKVFTTSNGTVTYGSTQLLCTVSNGLRGDQQMISYCASDKFVIGYIKNGDSQNTSTNSCARVCTISGTTATAGSESVVSSGYTNGWRLTCDQVIDNRIFGFYIADTGFYRLRIVAATVSGTSISWGTHVVMSGDNANPMHCDYINGRVIYTMKDHNTGYNMRVGAATISGNSITAGSLVTYDPTTHGDTGGSVRMNPNDTDQFLLAYQDQSNNNYGTVRLGSVSGTTITLGTATVFETGGSSDSVKSAWDLNNTGSFLLQSNNGSHTLAVGRAKLRVCSVSGTTLTFGSEISIPDSQGADADGPYFNPSSSGTADFYHVWLTNLTGQADVSAFSQVGGATTTNLSDKFIGFSKQAYSHATTATILVDGSVTSNQSSLTPADKYYVQGDGTLNTTAATPSVYAGISISATDLLIKGSQ